jgi:hypothetical protein
MSLSESELNRLILSALPHSPNVPFVWVYSLIGFLAIVLNPWISSRHALRVGLGVILGSITFLVCNHFVDQESERNAKILSKILATGRYELRSVDEGEWIEIRAVENSEKVYLGISHAESVDQVLKKNHIHFFDLLNP